MWKYLLLDLYKRIRDDDFPTYAATITYFLILSLFPFLIFLITLLTRTALFNFYHYFNILDALKELNKVIPADITAVIEQGLGEINSNKSDTFLSISLVLTIYSASRGVRAVMRIMNKAYDTRETRGFFRILFMSFMYTVGLALLLLAGFTFVLLTSAIGTKIFDWLGVPEAFKVWNFLIGSVLPIAVMVVVYMFIYRFTPNVKLTFGNVWAGSLFATIASIIASMFFSIYVTHFANYSVIYGGLGSIIVLLIWLYMISFILVLGGEINASLQSYRNR